MNKTEIKNNYNVVKIVSSKELLTLSQTYKDNLDTIIVMMKRKTNNPSKPPQWFADWYENIYKIDVKRIVNMINNIIKLNNLKTE